MITYRLNQTVCTAFVYKALVGWRHPHAGKSPRLTGIPSGAASCWEAGRAVAPQRLAGAGDFVHQDHRGIDELALVRRGGDDSRNRSGTGCCRVCPGGRRQRGHAAASGVQAVLGLWNEMTNLLCVNTNNVCVEWTLVLRTCRWDLDGLPW